MLKTICTVAIFYCLAVLCSCQKEIDGVNDTPVTVDTTPASESYLPLTTNSFWVYQDSASGESDSAIVLGDQWLYNNVTFIKIRTVSATEEDYSYEGILNHNYYIYAQQNGVGLTMLVLNDDVSASSSWVYDMGIIGGLPTRGTGTVIEKGITYSLQGKLYQNVIHTRYIIASNVNGTYTDVASYDFYFAKGIGIIKVTFSVSDATGGTDSATQELTDYTIK